MKWHYLNIVGRKQVYLMDGMCTESISADLGPGDGS